MTITLANGNIILTGEGSLDFDQPILDVDVSNVPRSEDYKFLIRFNEGMWVELEEELLIPEWLRGESSIWLEVHARPLNKKVPTLTFKSDALPMTRALILGEPVEQIYPEYFKSFEERMDKIDAAMVQLSMEGNLYQFEEEEETE